MAQLAFCLDLVCCVKQLLGLKPLLDVFELLSGALLDFYHVLLNSCSLLEEPEVPLQFLHIVDLREFNVFETLLLKVFQVLILLLLLLSDLFDLLFSDFPLETLLQLLSKAIFLLLRNEGLSVLLHLLELWFDSSLQVLIPSLIIDLLLLIHWVGSEGCIKCLLWKCHFSIHIGCLVELVDQLFLPLLEFLTLLTSSVELIL